MAARGLGRGRARQVNLPRLFVLGPYAVPTVQADAGHTLDSVSGYLRLAWGAAGASGINQHCLFCWGVVLLP